MPTLTTAGQRRPTTDSTTEAANTEAASTEAASTTDRRSRWGRLLDALLPASPPDRLVGLTEVSRSMVPFAESCLADAEIGAVIQELRATNGDSRFRILVAAHDRATAQEVLAGL
jgi:hypothetical protein